MSCGYYTIQMRFRQETTSHIKVNSCVCHTKGLVYIRLLESSEQHAKKH